MVKRSEEEDGSGEPENAQFRDLEETWSRVEAADGDGEEAVHRRGEEVEVSFGLQHLEGVGRGSRQPLSSCDLHGVVLTDISTKAGRDGNISPTSLMLRPDKLSVYFIYYHI